MSRFRKTPFIPPVMTSQGCTVEVVEDDVANRKRHFVRKSVDDIVPDLPSPDNFTLEKAIQAGVPLKEVNSKILDVEPSANVLFGAQQFMDAKEEDAE